MQRCSWCVFGLFAAAAFGAGAVVHGEDSRYAPQPQAALKQMLPIEWKKGPSLPQGFQDSAGGLVDGVLVTAGGFCNGASVPGKEKCHPRGFLRSAWGLDLDSTEKKWQTLPDLPGVGRQGLVGVTVSKKLYCWGGFNYTAPFCCKDGYCLSRQNGQWQWQKMPDLPWYLASYGACAIGSKIYLMGGADYNEDYYSAKDRTGRVDRIGARLLVLDTDKLEAGWKEQTPCPGTPRFAHAVAAVDGAVYVIGGAAGIDNPTKKYRTIVDNWRYDPAKDSWQRLRDLPIASGNFSPGEIVAFDRYILLVGGYQYDGVLGVGGSLKPLYGKPTKHYAEKNYYSDVFVYDTRTGLFGTATSLPLNNNGATTVVQGNRIHLMGGETAGCEIEGEKFAHHPNLYLTGTIRENNQ